MNKSDLIKTLSAKHGIPKKLAEGVLSSFTSAVIAEVKKGSYVSLVGFGSFRRTERQERNSLNSFTNKMMRVPASKRPKFFPGEKFRAAVDPTFQQRLSKGQEG